MGATVQAVLFDFGGVLLTSPFEAFAAYEVEHSLPPGFLRTLNATNPDTNAWARLERGEVDFAEFTELFEAEAVAAGHRVDARAVVALLRGRLRPEMVAAVRRCRERCKTALVTNNFVPHGQHGGEFAAVTELFDVVVESSTAGVRKPDPRIYRLACELLQVDPAAAVFLDDLGVNLKPARAMGMRTIKVSDPAAALAELESVVGFALR